MSMLTVLQLICSFIPLELILRKTIEFVPIYFASFFAAAVCQKKDRRKSKLGNHIVILIFRK